MNVLVEDTKESGSTVVTDVPAECEADACRLVAEKRRWTFIETEHGYYAVDVVAFREWGLDDLEGHVLAVREGRIDTFRGLFQLSEFEDSVHYLNW